MLRTLLAACIALSATTAQAGTPPVRAVDGSTVDLSAGTVLVAWSMDDTASLDALRAAAAADRAGAHVVTLNLDGAGDRSALTPYLRSHGWSQPILTDGSGSLRGQLGVGPGDIIVLGDGAQVMARLDSSEVSAAALAALAPGGGATAVARAR